MLNPLSTRNLKPLVGIHELKRLCQSIATIGLICYPDPDDVNYRYHYFNPDWSPGKELAAVDNNEGASCFIQFDSHGAIILGTGHRVDMTPWGLPLDVLDSNHLWPGLINKVPPVFQSALEAFETDSLTFCIWRTPEDTDWQTGDIQFPYREGDTTGLSPVDFFPGYLDYLDGSANMLLVLDGNPETYWKWAQEYYDGNEELLILEPASLPVIQQIYLHQPLTQAMVSRLNPSYKISDIQTVIKAETGYPVG